MTNNRATDACRGKEALNWLVKKIFARDYAAAMFYYGDLEPDFQDWRKLGVRAAKRLAAAY